MLLIGFLLFQRGIGLGLFHEDPDFSYVPLLREIAATGADHVAIVVPWYQRDVRSTQIYRHPRFTVPDETVMRTIREARRMAFKVLLCPIIRLEVQKTSKEWRGTLAPADPAAWWKSYGVFVERLAKLGAEAGASLYCVGSELGTMDGNPEPWRDLVARVRRVFPGQLIYSANWDRLGDVGLWSFVDMAGISAYFQLGDGDRGADVEKLLSNWKGFREKLLHMRERINRPLVITEVGYLSQDGTADWPWDENAAEPIDLEEQRRCYEAFRRTWENQPDLAGVYFWNWYGWGGPKSREYTPRGKPAEREICAMFGAKNCPSNYGNDWLQH